MTLPKLHVRDLLVMTTIAAVSLAIGISWGAADNAEELIGIFAMFVLAVASYVLGARRPRSESNRWLRGFCRRNYTSYCLNDLAVPAPVTLLRGSAAAHYAG